MTMKDPNAEPATKGELNGIKAEMAEFRRIFSIELVRTNARIDQLRDDLTTQIKASTSTILKVVGDFAAQFQKVDRDQIITNYRVGELENRVKNLESHA